VEEPWYKLAAAAAAAAAFALPAQFLSAADWMMAMIYGRRAEPLKR